MTAEQGAALRQSLEDGLGVPSIALADRLGPWRADPPSYIWKPNDHHPNRKGIELLGKAVAEALIQHGIGARARSRPAAGRP